MGIPTPKTVKIAVGASYFTETGHDIQPDGEAAAGAAMALDAAIETGFALNQLRPMEFGGNMDTKAITLTLSSRMDGKLK